MKFDKVMREKIVHDILVDAKGRLELENDMNLEIEFEKNTAWKGKEYSYKFAIRLPELHLTSETYDKYLQMCDAAKRMFTYILNPEFIDLTICEEATRLEFDITGKI